MLVRCRDGDGSPVAVRLEGKSVSERRRENDESRGDEGQGGEHRGERARRTVVGVEVDESDLFEGDRLGGPASLLYGREKSGMDGSTESMMKVTKGEPSGMGEERRGERGGEEPFTRRGSICAERSEREHKEAKQQEDRVVA